MRRVLALVGAAAVLVVALLHIAGMDRPDTAGGGIGPGPGAGPVAGGEPQAVVGEWTQGGVTPAAVRPRGGYDREAALALEPLGPGPGAATLVPAGLAGGTMAWWALARPDRRVVRAVRRAVLASRRGPPRPALA